MTSHHAPDMHVVVQKPERHQNSALRADRARPPHESMSGCVNVAAPSAKVCIKCFAARTVLGDEVDRIDAIMTISRMRSSRLSRSDAQTQAGPGKRRHGKACISCRLRGHCLSFKGVTAMLTLAAMSRQYWRPGKDRHGAARLVAPTRVCAGAKRKADHRESAARAARSPLRHFTACLFRPLEAIRKNFGRSCLGFALVEAPSHRSSSAGAIVPRSWAPGTRAGTVSFPHSDSQSKTGFPAAAPCEHCAIRVSWPPSRPSGAGFSFIR